MSELNNTRNENAENNVVQKEKTKEYKIAIVGDKESVIGFRAVGFGVFEVNGAAEAEAVITKIAKENYAVIFIIENLAKDMKTVISRYIDKPVPAIISLPGKDGSSGFGIAQIKKAVERAVGADILFKGNN